MGFYGSNNPTNSVKLGVLLHGWHWAC